MSRFYTRKIHLRHHKEGKNYPGNEKLNWSKFAAQESTRKTRQNCREEGKKGRGSGWFFSFHENTMRQPSSITNKGSPEMEEELC